MASPQTPVSSSAADGGGTAAADAIGDKQQHPQRPQDFDEPDDNANSSSGSSSSSSGAGSPVAVDHAVTVSPPEEGAATGGAGSSGTKRRREEEAPPPSIATDVVVDDVGGGDQQLVETVPADVNNNNNDDDDDSSQQQQQPDDEKSPEGGGGSSGDAFGEGAQDSSDPHPNEGGGGASSSNTNDNSDEDDDGVDHAVEDGPPSVPWTPQDVQSTCEFTHTITGYAEKRESGCKKAEYSATTVDEYGNRWRLIIYVNGNGRASNHHLSLFLQVADADDLPFGWKKGVSYVLTLEHPKVQSLSYAKRNPDKTFKLCPKAIDWGWSQFITSDRIQQEGFVDNDSLTVRASVTVKSSSVSIDEEDAELYLKYAVEEGDAEAVKLCLEQGASVNCKFKDDLYTPLHTACSSGNASSSSSSNNSNSSNGSSNSGESNNKGSSDASDKKDKDKLKGSVEVLKLLLARGADPNACNKWKETPLLIAANNGHFPACEELLEHGGDPSLCSEAGWSALTFAAHKVRARAGMFVLLL